MSESKMAGALHVLAALAIACCTPVLNGCGAAGGIQAVQQGGTEAKADAESEAAGSYSLWAMEMFEVKLGMAELREAGIDQDLDLRLDLDEGHGGRLKSADGETSAGFSWKLENGKLTLAFDAGDTEAAKSLGFKNGTAECVYEKGTVTMPIGEDGGTALIFARDGSEPDIELDSITDLANAAETAQKDAAQDGGDGNGDEAAGDADKQTEKPTDGDQAQ